MRVEEELLRADKIAAKNIKSLGQGTNSGSSAKDRSGGVLKFQKCSWFQTKCSSQNKLNQLKASQVGPEHLQSKVILKWASQVAQVSKR